MTKQEAIALVREVSNYMATRPEIDEAIDMAIEALEQRPSCRNTRQVDLISRQAAIDAIAKFVPYAICDESTESYTNGLMDAYNLICQLPSAQLRGMSKYIKLEDAIHAIAENMAQEANLKEHCNEPTFCAGEFLVEAEMSVKDLPTIEVSNDCISKDVMHAIDMAIEALEQVPKRGKWIDVEHQLGMQCSECGKMCNEITLCTDMMTEAHWNYCPNCGARMETGQ